MENLIWIVIVSLVVIKIIVILLIRLYLKMTIAICVSKASMKGKVVIVTGANSGIGFEVAKDLAQRGGRVILACRNEAKALEARDKIITETGNKNVVYRNLDLASLASVRRFVETVSKTEERLDVLVNNAGIVGPVNNYTDDGIVECAQVNYFAPFLLTLLLVPMLKKTKGRIVNTSSIVNILGRINLSRINKLGNHFFVSYINGKLCGVLFTVELAERLKGSGVTVNALHPGVVYTNITSKKPVCTRLAFWLWCWLCIRSMKEAAQTTIHVAVSEECASVTGQFYMDCKPSSTFRSSKANRADLRQALWDYSEKLVGFSDEKQFITLQVSQQRKPNMF